MSLGINRPTQFSSINTFAYIPVGTAPVTIRDQINSPVYYIIETAINRITQMVQVFVYAKTTGNFNLFAADYPTVTTTSDPTLSDPENWDILVFPYELPDSSDSPADYLYYGVGKHYSLSTYNSNLSNRG